MEIKTANKNIYLAVLPLEVLSDDSKVDIFCQGLVMDLITDLSRFRSFRIISHNTTKNINPKEEPGAELDNLHLDYLAKGMVRGVNEKLTVNLQLINVRENRLVWAEKFVDRLDALFHIEEEIVEKIVVSLQQFVDYDLLEEIRKKPPTKLNVYECWLKGYNELKKGSLANDEKAREYFQQAMELDPSCSRAYTGMSLTFFNEWSCQLWSRWDVSKNGAFEWAQKALELDEWDHVSNMILGRIYLFNEEYEKAEHYLRKSLRINSNDTETLIPIAVSFVYLGYLKESKELHEKAQRLNPAQSFAVCSTFMHFESGDYERAIHIAEQQDVSLAWVDFPAYQAASYYLNGNTEKAIEYWQIYLENFSKIINGGKPTNTDVALKWMIDVNPYKIDTRLKPFWEFISQSDLKEYKKIQREQKKASLSKFNFDNDSWKVSFAEQEMNLPDLKGCHDIARLLEQPFQQIHCTDLMGAETIEKGEEVFDDKAKRDYQKKIQHLLDEIEEAEMMQNSDRAAELKGEYEMLVEHLSASIGKGGKARKVPGTIEKCRTAVTWRIRSAIKKISEAHPKLGKHFEISIKTGIFCEYSPENKIDWILK